MAGIGGLEAEPQLATGKWNLNHKNPAHATGDAMPVMLESDQVVHDMFNDGGPKAADSSAERSSRKVVTGLPRSQTFERKLSEERTRLEPVATTLDERRAASVDKRFTEMNNDFSVTSEDSSTHAARGQCDPFLHDYGSDSPLHLFSGRGNYQLSGKSMNPNWFDSTTQFEEVPLSDSYSVLDGVSMTASQHDAMIADELEKKWILNLSMHFRDRSKREKFFITYRKKEHLWRRVTISLDYRDARPNSLEMDLLHTRYQRDKSAKIYEAIRDSLSEIAFYDTVTNLKLQTTNGRLHVHVVEDGNEIINWPSVNQVRHLGCKCVRESEIVFESHMSGFVYKVHVHGQILIKKEIPSPDTIEEFLYEVIALSALRYSKHVVQLYGVVVDNYDENVKGLLISYAEQGALIDIIYDNCKERSVGIPWKKRQRWARQIVQGLADIHESGFVQGDFTLSNIVVDAAGDAKIIDINRRGCPVGWEPPEATALIEANHRITMYIGVKSDLFQLGMVLWGLAMLEDEPETHGRPLMLGPEINVPDWYRQMTEICLNDDPRMRVQASSLLFMFPPDSERHAEAQLLVDDTHSMTDYSICESRTRLPYYDVISTVEPSGGWQYSSKTYVDPSSDSNELYYPTRGRSPPSPLPSHGDDYESTNKYYSSTSWAANKSVRPSYSDVADDDSGTPNEEIAGTALRGETPLSLGKSLGKGGVDSAAYIPVDVNPEDISPKRAAELSMERKRSLGDGLQMLSTPKSFTRTTTTLSPPADVGQHIALPMDEDLGTISRAVGGHSICGYNGTPSDAQAPKTSESETDGGVSLRSATDTHGLGIVQPSPTFGSTSLEQHPPGDKTELTLTVRGSQTKQDNMKESIDSDAHAVEYRSTKIQQPAVNLKILDQQCLEHKELIPKVKTARCSQLFPRQNSLPLSLAGIGAGLHLETDANTKNLKHMDDEFNTVARPATVQALMVATESQR